MKAYEGYKWCPHCECVLPVELYSKHKGNIDGLQHECKDCVIEYRQTEVGKESIRITNKKYYQKNKERILQNHKEYGQTDKGKEVHRRGNKTYNKTEHGKLVGRINFAKHKGLGYEEIFDYDFLCGNKDYHHISDAFVIPIPAHIHDRYIYLPCDEHREALKPIIEEMYDISYVVIDNVCLDVIIRVNNYE